jgi:hypothetical protein
MIVLYKEHRAVLNTSIKLFKNLVYPGQSFDFADIMEIIRFLSEIHEFACKINVIINSF